MSIKKDLTGLKFDRWTVSGEQCSKNGILYWKCNCFCGKSRFIRGADLKSGKTKSCGCLRKEIFSEKYSKNILGQRFGRLLVVEKSKIKSNTVSNWICNCDCGNSIICTISRLNNGTTKSCGCLQKEIASKNSRARLVGQKFNNLLVIEFYESDKHKKASWRCLCDCGKHTVATTGSLRSGKIKTCGNCFNFKNGRLTSNIAIELHKIINNKGIHNYKTKLGPCLDIALVNNGQKVGIEYDEWYWHGGRQKEDAVRIQKLLECGWKIIQIKASQNLPTVEQINEALNALNNVNHYIIQLPNWGTRKYFKQGEEDVS